MPRERGAYFSNTPVVTLTPRRAAVPVGARISDMPRASGAREGAGNRANVEKFNIGMLL